MTTLIAGFGSIGARHARNLAALGVSPLAAAEPDGARREQAEALLGRGQVAASLQEALERWAPFENVIIASPTGEHMAQASAAVGHTAGLFIEKPLGSSMDGVTALCEAARRENMTTMVACNMRFYPAVADMARRLREGEIGRAMYARLRFGQYLPAWRPGADYRTTYSAIAAQGGGIVLDDIHELDLAVHLLGPVSGHGVMGGRLSRLEIDVEDFASINLRMASGAVAHVMMDYLHPLYRREIEVVGEEGALWWTEDDNTLRVCAHGETSWQVALSDPSYDYNQSYMDQMRHFLDCGARKVPPMNSCDEAARLLGVALAIRDAARKGGMA